MLPRFHVEVPLRDAGASLDLPAGAARHVQVRRLQPGAAIVLFDGTGGEWTAEVEHIGRRAVTARLGMFCGVDRELPQRVTLAVGMPANDRMDTLVEKACELGAVVVQPLVCTRSVLRPAGERADRKVAHWRGVAVAASEQCGRTRVPTIEPVRPLADWLADLEMPPAEARVLLSVREPASPAPLPPPLQFTVLSGPEGGLTEAEEDAAQSRGFMPVSLGPRVLRADTAPLAWLSHLALTRQGSR
jgi:16S rRNA (uracil1498-N3)-methyltransferase